MAENPGLPRIAVIGTGGTISSVGRDSLDIATYADTGEKYQVDELLARFPEAVRVAEPVPVRYRAVGSRAIGPAEWLELHRLIHDTAAAERNIAGVVLTHGTSTLEESAYFLNLTVRLDIPVVLVGAQRPASALSTDAGLNLVNALRVAGSPDSRGRGVLVVLNDEIHAARDVTKTSTLRLHTFKSPDFGPLGHADADRVAYYRAPVRRHAPDAVFELEGRDSLPRVDIAMSYAGADGAAIDAFVEAGAEGIVSAGLLPGFVTAAELEAYDRAVEKGIVVVQSVRNGSGRLIAVRTGRPKRCVLADNLSPAKARILLMLALTRTCDPAEIQAMFEIY